MRGLLMATGLAAALAAGGLVPAGTAAAQDDKTYDLRGPAPKVNQEYVSKMTMKIKDADATLKVGGMTLDLKMSMDVVGEEEQKVLAIDGRNVTKSRSKIVKERADITT